MTNDKIGEFKLNVKDSYVDAETSDSPIAKPVISNQDIYLNSECLFIEYNDVLRCPLYTLLRLITKVEKLRGILDLSIFDNYDDLELYEWYLNRKHNNFYYDIPLVDKNNQAHLGIFDSILTNELKTIPGLFEISPMLSMVDVVNNLITTGKSLVKHIIVYNNYDNPNVRNDIPVLFPNSSVEYAAGNILQVLSNVPNNSTFVFSDIMKVQAMVDINKIQLSSVLIVDGLRYNYDDDMKLKIDFEELLKTYTFKYSFFKNYPIPPKNTEGHKFVRESN